MKTRYRLVIEPLTAIHVGTGETLTPLNYIVKELKEGSGRWLYCAFEWEKILGRLITEDKQEALNRYTQAVDRADMKFLQAFFHGEFKFDDLLYPCDMTKEFIRLYHANIKKDPIENAAEVHRMYRPRGKKTPLIPGSSLKGAIRTALLDFQMQPDKMSDAVYNKLRDEFDKTEGDTKEKQRERSRFDNTMQKQLFSYNDAKSDPLRALIIRDAAFAAKGTQLTGCLKNLRNEFGRGALSAITMQIQAEVIRGSLLGSKESAETAVLIDGDLQRSTQLKTYFSMEDIRNACNEFYLDEFKTEYNKFYQGCVESVGIIDKLKSRLDAVKNDRQSFAVRLGRWIQAEFLTYNKDFRDPQTPKRHSKKQDWGTTRTVLDYDGEYVPLGWCICRFEKEGS